MNKFYILLIASLFSVALFGQVKVSELPIKYESNYFTNKESLAISNSNSNELVVLVEDDEKTSIYLQDSDFKETSNLETESLPRSFKNFLGYSIIGDEYTIFLFE